MSGGKGGKSRSEAAQRSVNQVPPFSEAMGIRNIMAADQIAGLGPIRNYGPTVAAFNPMQISKFQNTANTARAFGLDAPEDPLADMPEAQDFGGGIMGYSAAPVVDQMLAELEAQAPGQFDAMTSMYMDPVTGERPETGPFAPVEPGILQDLLDEYEQLRIKA
jgi:hypothetical protein